jgi:hypothetical protein
MNKERLRKWAKLLESVAPENFNMRHYGDAGKPIGSKPVCATAACALGWATAVPEFHKAGLRLVAYPGDRFATVEYKGLQEEEAAVAFFGIDAADARTICLTGFDMTAKEKAQHIRNVFDL